MLKYIANKITTPKNINANEVNNTYFKISSTYTSVYKVSNNGVTTTKGKFYGYKYDSQSETAKTVNITGEKTTFENKAIQPIVKMNIIEKEEKIPFSIFCKSYFPQQFLDVLKKCKLLK